MASERTFIFSNFFRSTCSYYKTSLITTFWTKVANIALMPLLVAALGLGVALTRRRRAQRALAAGAAA